MSGCGGQVDGPVDRIQPCSPLEKGSGLWTWDGEREHKREREDGDKGEGRREKWAGFQWMKIRSPVVETHPN